MTLEQILSEPAILNDEMKVLTEQTQELALTNYRTFVETAECSSKILDDFKESKSALNELLDKFPIFINECEKLSSMSKDILKNRRRVVFNFANSQSNLQIQYVCFIS